MHETFIYESANCERIFRQMEIQSRRIPSIFPYAADYLGSAAYLFNAQINRRSLK